MIWTRPKGCCKARQSFFPYPLGLSLRANFQFPVLKTVTKLLVLLKDMVISGRFSMLELRSSLIFSLIAGSG